MVKKIVFFNHKGGVSKTTSTFNIGWKLAEMGHRVLLVDADPQCNLTSVFLGKTLMHTMMMRTHAPITSWMVYALLSLELQILLGR